MILPAFFLFTFALTWTAWRATMVLAPAGTGIFGLRGPLFLLGVFAPAIVALALTGWRDGRAGVGCLLGRIGRWNVGLRWYVFAVVYMMAVKLAAALVQRIAFGAWPRFGSTPVVILLAAVVISTWAQAGEEIGWRGYALPRLARHLGLGGASLLLGAIWAVWHLPLFFIAGASAGQSFVMYFLWVTALSVAVAWLYWKTRGSLLLTMIMHASVNNTTDIVPAGTTGAVGLLSFSGSPVLWGTIGFSWLVAGIFLLQMRGASIADLIDRPETGGPALRPAPVK